MNRKSRLLRLAVVVGLCALAGAAAGIAGSAAAPSSSKTKKGAFTRHLGPGRGFHGPAVHADTVVLNKAGKAFITETEDSGKVKSVSGDQLVITEGVKNVTYKDVTLTIPANATVVRNFAKAKLSDLKADDFVHVSQSSDGTFVLASDASHRPFGRHFGLRGGHPGGPPGDARREGGPWPPGPPPGAPPA